jgi:hypothetical protein
VPLLSAFWAMDVALAWRGPKRWACAVRPSLAFGAAAVHPYCILRDSAASMPADRGHSLPSPVPPASLARFRLTMQNKAMPRARSGTSSNDAAFGGC